MQNRREWKLLKLEEMLASVEDLPQYPSIETIGYMLQKCREEKNGSSTRRLYDYIQKFGLENHPSIGNYLVPMLADAGNVCDAHKVFHNLDFPNEYSWNSLITCFIKYGDPQKAFILYQKMCISSVKPTAYTFVALLKACANSKDVERGKSLHYEIISSNLETQIFVGSSLIDMYAKCGLLEKSQEVFDKLLDRDAVSWNALIAGYFTHGLCEEAMNCFNQMEVEGVAPTSVTFIFILKLCGDLMNVCKGQQIHASVIETCFRERVPEISNALIDMYANCGFLPEAEDILNKFPSRNIFSWAALMGGYSKQKLDLKVINCFQKLCSDGIVPNVATSICSLKACGNIGDVKKAEEVHHMIRKEGSLEKNDLIGTAMVDMFANCGMLEKAHEVFKDLSAHDIVSWTTLISGYSKHGYCEKALELFKEMRFSGISPDTFCWNTLIEGYAKHGYYEEALTCFEIMQSEGISPDCLSFVFTLIACGSMGLKNKAEEIYTEIAMRGFLEKEIVVGNALVDFYVTCGMILEAQHVFDKLPASDVISWTALLGGYANHGLGEKALDFFLQMQFLGIAPSPVTFVCILKACGNVCAREMGRDIHSEIEKKGFFEHELFIGNALIDMYANCGLLDEAQEVFDILPSHDIISWTSLIAGYSMHGYCEEAMNCFEHMNHNGIIPDAVSWSALIAGYAKHNLREEALNCLELMKLEGISPDAVTYASSLKACGTIRLIEKGKDIYAEITVKGLLESDIVVGNALVDLYATCGLLEEAQDVFDGLPMWDAISWTTLIAGYTKHGYGEEALCCFDHMKKEGFTPDVLTYLCTLKACGSMGATEKGEKIHEEIVAHGLIEKDLIVANAVIDMYTSFGFVQKAQGVFNQLPVQNAVSWTSLIAGYAKHGSANDALNCLEDMQGKGVSPDALSWNALIAGYAHLGESESVFHVLDKMISENVRPSVDTLISVLTACSHAGLVSTSQVYIECISKEYGIELSIEHHVCMIDMFARVGQLDKAVALIKLMPYHPNLVVWHTILGACRKWGDVDIGIWAFSHAVQLDEGDVGAYVSLYNIYAAVGMQQHAKRVEEMSIRKQWWPAEQYWVAVG